MGTSGRNESLSYFEFIPYVRDNQYYIEDNDIDAIDIHDYAKGCYKLKEEILKHYPGLYNMSYELLVEYYFSHVGHYGEINDPLHLAHLIAGENSVPFVDSDCEPSDDSVPGMDTDSDSDATLPLDVSTVSTFPEKGSSFPKTGKQGVVDSYFSVSTNKKIIFRCGICNDVISNIEHFSLLDCCSHQFCHGCITNWCKIKPSCPICRQGITRIDKMYMI